MKKELKGNLYLKVESTQNKLFENFIYHEVSNGYFTKDDFTSYIYYSSLSNNLDSRNYRRIYRNSYISSINIKLFGSEIVTIEIAQNIAEIVITRAEKKKIISKIEEDTLSETYKIKTTANMAYK